MNKYIYEVRNNSGYTVQTYVSKPDADQHAKRINGTVYPVATGL